MIKADNDCGWIHGSLKPSGNRKQCLRMSIVKGKKVYTNYIPKWKT